MLSCPARLPLLCMSIQLTRRITQHLLLLLLLLQLLVIRMRHPPNSLWVWVHVLHMWRPTPQLGLLP